MKTWKVYLLERAAFVLLGLCLGAMLSAGMLSSAASAVDQQKAQVTAEQEKLEQTLDSLREILK
jgi:hypothetical protein